MSRLVLGIDVQRSRLEAVLVRSGLRETRLAGCRSVALAGGPGEGGADPLRAGLEAALSLKEARNADCAVSLPAEGFFLRTAAVPFASPKKIRLVLPYELEPDLPLAADALAFAFAPLGPARAAGKTEVLAAAIEKERLEAVTAAFAACGLEAARITPSGYALALWAARSAGQAERFFHLEVEERFAALYLAEGGRVRLGRSFPLPAAGAEREAALLRQVRLTLGMLDLGGEAGEDLPPPEILLSGLGADGLDPGRLAEGLALPVRGIDLLAASGIPGGEEAGWDPRRMNGALALALAEIENLRGLRFGRGAFPGRQILLRHRGPLVRTAALAVAALALGLGQAAVETALLQRRASELDRRMAAVFREAFPEARAAVDPYLQMRAGLQELKKLSAAAPGAAGSLRSIDLLKRLSEAVPEEIPVVFERLVIGPEGIQVSGTTAGFQEVEAIKAGLERAAAFKAVTIGAANLDRSGKEVNFQLKVDL